MTATAAARRRGRARPRRGLGQELRDLWLGGRGLVLSLGLQRAAERDRLPRRDEHGAQLPRAARGGQPPAAGRDRGRVRSCACSPPPTRSAASASAARSRPAAHALAPRRARSAASSGRALAVARSVRDHDAVRLVPRSRRRQSSAIALAAGVVVGTLLAIFLASLGVLISVFAASNRVSLSISLFLLLALYRADAAPDERAARVGRRAAATRQPDHRRRALRRARSSSTRMAWSEDAAWLLSPVVAAMAIGALAVAGGRWISLRGGPAG